MDGKSLINTAIFEFRKPQKKGRLLLLAGVITLLGIYALLAADIALVSAILLDQGRLILLFLPDGPLGYELAIKHFALALAAGYGVHALIGDLLLATLQYITIPTFKFLGTKAEA